MGEGDNKSTFGSLDIVFINEVLMNIKGDHPSLSSPYVSWERHYR